LCFTDHIESIECRFNGLSLVLWAKECSTISARVIATCFALGSFTAALLIGAAVGNEPLTILWRATVAMGLCWLIGLVVGQVMQRSVDDHVERYKQSHPIVNDFMDGESDQAGVRDDTAAARTRPSVSRSSPQRA